MVKIPDSKKENLTTYVKAHFDDIKLLVTHDLYSTEGKSEKEAKFDKKIIENWELLVSAASDLVPTFDVKVSDKESIYENPDIILDELSNQTKQYELRPIMGILKEKVEPAIGYGSLAIAAIYGGIKSAIWSNELSIEQAAEHGYYDSGKIDAGDIFIGLVGSGLYVAAAVIPFAIGDYLVNNRYDTESLTWELSKKFNGSFSKGGVQQAYTRIGELVSKLEAEQRQYFQPKSRMFEVSDDINNFQEMFNNIDMNYNSVDVAEKLKHQTV